MRRIPSTLALATLALATLALTATGWVPAAAAGPPPNDHFADGEIVSGLPVAFTGSTIESSMEAGEPQDCGDEPYVWYTVWFRYTADSTRRAMLTITGGATARVVVHTGASLPSLTQITCATTFDEAPFWLRAGTTYHLQVGASTGTLPEFTVRLDQAPDAESIAYTAFTDAVIVRGCSRGSPAAYLDACLTAGPGEQADIALIDATQQPVGVRYRYIDHNQSVLGSGAFCGSASLHPPPLTSAIMLHAEAVAGCNDIAFAARGTIEASYSLAA